jgi:hypothetical protein
MTAGIAALFAGAMHCPAAEKQARKHASRFIPDRNTRSVRKKNLDAPPRITAGTPQTYSFFTKSLTNFKDDETYRSGDGHHGRSSRFPYRFRQIYM